MEALLMPKCNQCQPATINGVFCHEAGCPNQRKTWVPDRNEWVLFVECDECGVEVEVGTECGCFESMLNTMGDIAYDDIDEETEAQLQRAYEVPALWR
jgi:hypothetical protein